MSLIPGIGMRDEYKMLLSYDIGLRSKLWVRVTCDVSIVTSRGTWHEL